MAPIFKGMTDKSVAAKCGCHAEIVSDGARAVLSLLDLAAKIWSMAIIDPAKDLASEPPANPMRSARRGNPKCKAQ